MQRNFSFLLFRIDQGGWYRHVIIYWDYSHMAHCHWLIRWFFLDLQFRSFFFPICIPTFTWFLRWRFTVSKIRFWELFLYDAETHNILLHVMIHVRRNYTDHTSSVKNRGQLPGDPGLQLLVLMWKSCTNYYSASIIERLLSFSKFKCFFFNLLLGSFVFR